MPAWKRNKYITRLYRVELFSQTVYSIVICKCNYRIYVLVPAAEHSPLTQRLVLRIIHGWEQFFGNGLSIVKMVGNQSMAGNSSLFMD